MANPRTRVTWIQPLAGDAGSGGSRRTQAVPQRRQRVLRALERRLGIALEEAAAVLSLAEPSDLVALLPHLGRLCSASSTRLFLLDGADLTCVARLPADPGGGTSVGDDLPAREIDQAVATGRPAVVEPAIQLLGSGARPCSWLVLPLAGGGVKHGALVLGRQELFSGEDLTV